MFDRAAGTSDDVGVQWFRPIADGLVGERAVQAGERVLDIGRGRRAALEPVWALHPDPTQKIWTVSLELIGQPAKDGAGVPKHIG